MVTIKTVLIGTSGLTSVRPNWKQLLSALQSGHKSHIVKDKVTLLKGLLNDINPTYQENTKCKWHSEQNHLPAWHYFGFLDDKYLNQIYRPCLQLLTTNRHRPLQKFMRVTISGNNFDSFKNFRFIHYNLILISSS